MQAAFTHLLMAVRPHLDFNNDLAGIPQHFMAMALITKWQFSGGGVEVWCSTIETLFQIWDDQHASCDLPATLKRPPHGDDLLPHLLRAFCKIAGEARLPST